MSQCPHNRDHRHDISQLPVSTGTKRKEEITDQPSAGEKNLPESFGNIHARRITVAYYIDIARNLQLCNTFANYRRGITFEHSMGNTTILWLQFQQVKQNSYKL